MEKNCGNCKHYNIVCKYITTKNACFNLDKWEFKEEIKDSTIQITEEQAREMILKFEDLNEGREDWFVNDIIKQWKSKGYIKQSALGKSREYIDYEIQKHYPIITSYGNTLKRTKDLYEQAIKEIEKDKQNLVQDGIEKSITIQNLELEITELIKALKYSMECIGECEAKQLLKIELEKFEGKQYVRNF